jgi:hypothetical protein
MGTGRSANSPGTNGYTTPGTAGGQLPGFTGAPQGYPGAPAGYGGSGFNPNDAGIPGLVQPGEVAPGAIGMPPTAVPEGKGVLPDFFKQIVGKRLTPGTVLTGVAETSISSVKSKRGDVFSISLPHGYSNEGEEIIPVNSRILGVVVDSMPAATQKPGMPGKLSISLKTIVFPDGRTSKINGFIDQNPAHLQESEPKTRFSGVNMGDYGKAFTGMLYSSVGGIGWVHNRAMRGKEFVLAVGTPVSVKLNTMLDVGKMTNPAAPLMGNPGVPGVPGLAPGAVPGVPNMMQGSMPGVPGLAPGAVQGSVPGLSGFAPGAVPGMPGPSPGAMQGLPAGAFSAVPGMNLPAGVAGLSNSLPPLQGANPSPGGGTFFPGNIQNPNQFQSGGYSQMPDDDPNSIFKTPLASPKVATPDPF